VTLPLYHAPDAALPESLKRVQRLRVDASECEGTGISSNHSKNSQRILVVDDTTMNRKLLIRLLQNKGHVCDEAEDGSIAVKQVETAIEEGKPYASILMDYEMPVMNGPTAAKEIRGLGCDSFIVGITGNLLPADISYFKSCGANSVLPKPLDFGDLQDLWMEYGVATSMSP
jgi:CheY-like chemotaxis protein